MKFLSKLFGGTPKQQPVHVDDTNFKAEVLDSDIPVVVDVWSDGCPPCKMLEPIIMMLAAHYDGKVKVCELHTKTGGKTAGRYQVRGTPTVLYFDKGSLVERTVGFAPMQYHQEVIDIALLGEAPKGE